MRTIRLLLSAIWDLWLLIMPKIRKQDAYVFIGHPGKLNDVSKQWSFARRIPSRWLQCLLRHLWPISGPEFMIENINGVMIRAKIIYCPLTAKMMIEDPLLARRAILKSALLAWKSGARIISLGGLTASFSQYGLDIKNMLGREIGVTTGHAYTTAVVLEHTVESARRIGVELKDATVAIIGGGSIGNACLKFFSKIETRGLLLIDKNPEVLRQATLDFGSQVDVSLDIKDINKADIVIVAVCAPNAVVEANDLKHGTLIIDDSFPPGVAKGLVKQRRDITVVKGGVVNLPYDLDHNLQFGLRRGEAYSCFVEGLILALIDWDRDYNLGKVDLTLVREIAQIAKRLGFYPAFRSLNPVVNKGARRATKVGDVVVLQEVTTPIETIEVRLPTTI